MDRLDLRLLRAMFRDELFSVTGIDPRISITRLAAATGASRLTVRRRIAMWRKLGVWGKVMVYPNPAALGGTFGMVGVRVVGEPAQRHFLRLADLAIPAVMSFQTEDVWVFLTVSSNPETLQSCIRKICAEPGVQLLGGPVPVPFPAPKGTLRAADWDLISALRKTGDLDWESVARSLSVNPRAFRRRVLQLFEREQLYFYPYIDFRVSHGTVVHVATFVSVGADPSLVFRSIRKRFPEVHRIEPLFPTLTLLPPELRQSVADEIQFMLPVESMATTDRLRRELGDIPGVCNSHVAFPVQNAELRNVLDEMIAVRQAS